jgi:hypothetical protein
MSINFSFIVEFSFRIKFVRTGCNKTFGKDVFEIGDFQYLRKIFFPEHVHRRSVHRPARGVPGIVADQGPPRRKRLQPSSATCSSLVPSRFPFRTATLPRLDDVIAIALLFRLDMDCVSVLMSKP